MHVHPRNEHTDRPFNAFFPDVRGKSVLDFGGNRGNILHFNPDIDRDKYTCVEVDKEPLEVGKGEFGTGNWIHYDRYNMDYNPGGSVDAKLPDIPHHDCAWAYSVFSHTDCDEMVEIVDWLAERSNTVVFSFLDINNRKVKQHFYDKRVEAQGQCVDFVDKTGDLAYLIGNNEWIENARRFIPKDSMRERFLAFYDQSFLMKLFAGRYKSVTIWDRVYHVPFMVINQ